MWCLGRRKSPDINHIQGSHLVHYPRHVDKDLLCRVDDYQRRVRWLLCCQVRAVWRDWMDRHYLLRVRKHLLRYKPVLFSMSLNSKVRPGRPMTIKISSLGAGSTEGLFKYIYVDCVDDRIFTSAD